MTVDPVAVAACAGVGAVAGAVAPLLIRRIPEPEGDVVEEADGGEPPSTDADDKESYASVAASSGLAWKTAVASGLAAGLVGFTTGWAWPLLFLLPLVPVSVALAVIDWRTRLLPTAVIAPAYGMTVVLVLVCAAITRDTDDLVRAGWGWLVAGGTYFVLWVVHPRGLGYGDVRLSGLLGIALGYLGWPELTVGVYAGFLLGGVGGGLLSILRIVERKAFPFGPFMLLGALAGVVVGVPIADLAIG